MSLFKVKRPDGSYVTDSETGKPALLDEFHAKWEQGQVEGSKLEPATEPPKDTPIGG